jgi:hypothetical protein
LNTDLAAAAVPVPARGREGPRRTLQGAAVLAALGLIALLSPLPDRVTDRGVYEATAAQRIVPDCSDLHCFRVLVAWTLGAIPGPSLLKWKAYAVVGNLAAAFAVFELCLTFGLNRRTAWMTSLASAFGFGSLYTLHDPYTSDPLMFALGPVMVNTLLKDRVVLSGAIGAVGVLAKEFAAAPLFVFAAAAALERRWSAAGRVLVAANLVFIVWAVLQLTLIVRFNYSYGGNASTHLLTGSGVGPWFAQQSLRGALSAVFNEYGALYLLAPVGFLFAPGPLRRLTVAAIPAAIVFSYLQQPDRALWNFHFLVVPLAAIALDRAPAPLAWTTLVAFVVANLRVGAQLPAVPAARFALAASVVLAAAGIVATMRAGVLRGQPGEPDHLALT